MYKYFGLAIFVLAGSAPGRAQAQSVPQTIDLGQYTLFNPVPDGMLRDLATDRPGKSHSPLTLDAGHWQVESDIWNDSFDHWSPDQQTTRLVTLGDPNLKLGLNSWSELDAILPTYESLDERSRTGGGVRHAYGIGDLQLGGKVNFWGNNGSATAYGMIGYVKVPTAAQGLGNNMIEAEVSTPYVTSLPANFSVTLEPQVGLMRQADKQGYAGDYAFFANLNHPVFSKNVTVAIELALDYSSDHNTGTRDSIDPSIQWQIGRNLQLDAGAYFGITKAAPDFNPYVGFSYRY